MDGVTFATSPTLTLLLNQLKPIFGKSFHTDLRSHTGEYIATEISKVIEEQESECGKMVFEVVTENANNIKKKYATNRRKKYPTITLGNNKKKFLRVAKLVRSNLEYIRCAESENEVIFYQIGSSF